jgi:hypothetical protein
MNQPAPPDDPAVDLTDPAIQAHLAAQDDAPDGQVVMEDGTLRPLGGTDDNTEDGE